MFDFEDQLLFILFWEQRVAEKGQCQGGKWWEEERISTVFINNKNLSLDGLKLQLILASCKQCREII